MSQYYVPIVVSIWALWMLYLMFSLGNFANREIKVEKKYIAVVNGALTSGIQTRDNAIKWAAEQMSSGKQMTAYLAEVTDVIERKTPPIEVRPFVLPTQDIAKAA